MWREFSFRLTGCHVRRTANCQSPYYTESARRWNSRLAECRRDTGSAALLRSRRLLPLNMDRNTLRIASFKRSSRKLAMSTTKQAKDQGVRTPEGIRIYAAAVRHAISYEDKRDAATNKRDRERYDQLRIEALTKGLKEALALNPKPRPVKKSR